MRLSFARWFAAPGARPRLALCALSVLLLISLAACSSGKQTTTTTATATPPVASNPSHAPHICPHPPCNVLPPPVPSIHIATASNTQWDTTYLDNPLLNGNPSALITVTQAVVMNDTAGETPYSPTPQAQVGVWYNTSNQRWGIFREDELAMPIGAVFNVNPISGASSYALLQTATSSNSSHNYTEINSPYTNGTPSVHLVVTPNYNPGGVGASWDNHPLGLIYLQDGHWAIYHTDGNTPISWGATYNVQIGSGGASGGEDAAAKCLQPSGCDDLEIVTSNGNSIVNTSQSNWVLFVTQTLAVNGGGGIGIPLVFDDCSGSCPTPFSGGPELRDPPGFPPNIFYPGFPLNIFYSVYAYQIVCPC